MGMLAQMSWSQWFLTVLLIAVCGFLMLVVLIQRGRGGGLSGAFGGAGGTSAFGAKTGDVFTWITVVTTAVFLLLAIVANYVLDQSPRPAVAAPVTATPVTPEPATEGGPQPITIAPIEVPPTGGPAGDAGTAADTEGEATPSDAGAVAPSDDAPVGDRGDAAADDGGAADEPATNDEEQPGP